MLFETATPGKARIVNPVKDGKLLIPVHRSPDHRSVAASDYQWRFVHHGGPHLRVKLSFGQRELIARAIENRIAGHDGALPELGANADTFYEWVQTEVVALDMPLLAVVDLVLNLRRAIADLPDAVLDGQGVGAELRERLREGT